MKRFKNILVVYRDAVGDDGALVQITELAVRNGARRKRISRIASSITQQGGS